MRRDVLHEVMTMKTKEGVVTVEVVGQYSFLDFE